MIRRFLIGWIFLCCSCVCNAQTVSAGFYKEIIFTRTHYTLYELVATVAAQSGLSISFNAQKLDPRKHIRVRASRATVEKLMQILHQKSGLRYKLVKGHLLLLPPLKTSSLAIFNKRKAEQHPKNSLVPYSIIVPKIRLAEYADNPVKTQAVGDMLTVQPAVGADSSSATVSGGGNGGSTSGKWIDPYQSLSTDNGLRRYNGTLTQSSSFVADHVFAGISAGITESFYGNPTVHAGLDLLHLSLGYYFNPSFSHFRYGLGSNIKLNDRWQIDLAVSGGSRFRSNTNVPYNDTLPRTDTLLPPIIVSRNQVVQLSSKLTRFSLAFIYQLTPRLGAMGGIHLNVLRTLYTVDNRQIAPAALINPPINASDDFRTLKIPYYLSNSFDIQQSADRKLWLGLNLSLYYRLF